jgi:uncharacterized protein (DUF2336 family)
MSEIKGVKLNKDDVIKLAEHKSPERRVITAEKISKYYQSENITEEEIKLAEDIFRVMVKDAEVRVRQALSESLKVNPDLPKDVAIAIVNDIDAVSVPFLKCSEVLTEEDLIEVIHSSTPEKQKAVAQRENLQSSVCAEIVEKCHEEVVVCLVENENAQIAHNTFENIIHKYGENKKMQEKLVFREEIPVAVAEKLVTFVAVELQERLVTHHKLPSDKATDMVLKIREKATLKLSEQYGSDDKIKELIHQLYSSNRLTPSIVVRAICMGDLKFFEYALVYLTQMPIKEVRKTLYGSEIDFMVRNLLRKARIPKMMFPAVFNAMKVIEDMQYDGSKDDRAKFSKRVIERILTSGQVGSELDDNDVDYLISKIG